MPKALTLVLAGFIAGLLAAVALVAVAPRLTMSAESAATAEKVSAEPEHYGAR